MPYDSALLKNFVAVCDARSFAKAASAVNRAQSAVSRRIEQLEAKSCLRLFDRAGEGVSPTAAGELMLHYARRTLDMRAQAPTRRHQSRSPRIVRLGTPEIFQPPAMAELLAYYAHLNAHVALSIVTGMAPKIIAQFEAGQLDVLIVDREIGEGDGGVLYREGRVFAAAKDFDLDSSGPVPLAAFPPPCPWRRMAIERLKAIGRDCDIVLESNSVSGIFAAVRAGLAVAVMADKSVTDPLRILDAALGFPPLPDFEYVIRRNPKAPAEAIELGEAIIDFFQFSNLMQGVRLSA